MPRECRRLFGRLRAPVTGAILLSLPLPAPAPSAGAATLEMSGTLEIRIVGPSFTVPQSPSTLPVSVSSGGGTFTDPAGIFQTTVDFAHDPGQLPSPLFTGVPLITEVWFNFTNAGGSFSPGGGGGFGGTEPLSGCMIIGILGIIHLRSTSASSASRRCRAWWSGSSA